MWFTSRRYHAVFSYSLNSRKYFRFNGISIIYKMVAAINLTDSSGNQNKSQTKYGRDQISCQLMELRWDERARWQGGRALR